jgi:hypothetical protein
MLSAACLAAAVSAFGVADAKANVSFSPAPGSPFPVGDGPRAAAVGDFNGDGRPDIVVANYDSDNTTLLLGSGNGGFIAAPGSPFAVGDGPGSVAIADVNGDGHADVATANGASDDVSVLLGDGRGGFLAVRGSPFATGGNPRSVVAGEFDSDPLRRLDLATADHTSSTVTVLAGDGNGRFAQAAGSPAAVGSGPTSIAVVDVNLDGFVDLGVARFYSSDIKVLLGGSRGGLADGGTYQLPAGSQGRAATPASIAAGHFNADTLPDFVTANYGSDTVTFATGSAGGGFLASSTGAVGRSPFSVAVGDFNGDRRSDAASADLDAGGVTVLMYPGGAFTPFVQPFAVGGRPSSVVVGDFDGDGRQDLATTRLESDDVAVLLNTSAAAHAVSPELLDFGKQAPNTISETRTVAVKSSGDAELRPSQVNIVGSDATDFRVYGDTCTGATLAVGASCEVAVQFTPASRGPKAAKLEVSDNSPQGLASVVLLGGPPATFSCRTRAAARVNRVRVTCTVTAHAATVAKLLHRGRTIARRRLTAGTQKVVFRIPARGRGRFKLRLG